MGIENGQKRMGRRMRSSVRDEDADPAWFGDARASRPNKNNNLFGVLPEDSPKDKYD